MRRPAIGIELLKDEAQTEDASLLKEEQQRQLKETRTQKDPICCTVTNRLIKRNMKIKQKRIERYCKSLYFSGIFLWSSCTAHPPLHPICFLVHCYLLVQSHLKYPPIIYTRQVRSIKLLPIASIAIYRVPERRSPIRNSLMRISMRILERISVRISMSSLISSLMRILIDRAMRMSRASRNFFIGHD